MHPFVRRALFCFFFISGFSSLVYQVVWTRLAFASFGIMTPVLSVVLSVFMLGLAVGSWAGGRWIGPLVKQTRLPAAVFYGLAEATIGLGAFAVPVLFRQGEHLLSAAGELNSFKYLMASALTLTVSIFPWCVCMGATFPFMMAYFPSRATQSQNSFSFLYVANVLGAMTGTLLTALVLVEMLGFQHTLWVAAIGNFLIAIGSIALGLISTDGSTEHGEVNVRTNAGLDAITPLAKFNKIVLFATGFVSMATEVVWSRGFVGVLKTQVYSFALIVFTYLLATFAGSLLYRWDVRRNRNRPRERIFFWLAISTLFPVVVDDPSITVQYYYISTMDAASALLLLGSIVPLCALLGYLTPSLVDEFSAGDPKRAGSAYAINVVGCILGPLFASYFLLPNISSRYSLILLGLPFVYFWLASPRSRFVSRRIAGGIFLCAAMGYCVFVSRDMEEYASRLIKRSDVRRDYIASVIAYETSEGGKKLVVNGLGMTALTPITKCIASLPLAVHQPPAQSVLVICFGMGTTFRSSLTWGVDTTVVELAPSVPQEFGFYHADAEKYLKDPHAHIVIDDGRRYLNRCGKKFDIVTIDPPPPVQAAGSSLLYSTEFYDLVKHHLNPGGIVQMWYMEDDSRTNAAVARSIYSSFPYVRVFRSIEGWGVHLLASMQPIVIPPIDQVMANFPPAAQADLVEWNPNLTPRQFMQQILSGELNINDALNPDPSIQITDDRPMNEYYLSRRLLQYFK